MSHLSVSYGKSVAHAPPAARVQLLRLGNHLWWLTKKGGARWEREQRRSGGGGGGGACMVLTPCENKLRLSFWNLSASCKFFGCAAHASLYLAIVGQRPVCLGCASFCNFRWSRLFVFGEQKVIWMPFSSALPMATATATDNGSTRTARSRYRTRLTRCPCRTRREMHATSGDVLHSLNSVWAYVASRA